MARGSSGLKPLRRRAPRFDCCEFAAARPSHPLMRVYLFDFHTIRLQERYHTYTQHFPVAYNRKAIQTWHARQKSGLLCPVATVDASIVLSNPTNLQQKVKHWLFWSAGQKCRASQPANASRCLAWPSCWQRLKQTLVFKKNVIALALA